MSLLTRALAILAITATCASTAFARQMPDPRQMSGIPLPVPDLPTGTVTARVIRGALTKPLSGEIVQLTGAGVSQSAKTDEAGRATFSGLKPGVRVKAVAVVSGERIESQEFEVGYNGGTRLMLVASDAAGRQSAAGGDRAAAPVTAIPGAVTFGEQSRFVIETGDDALNVFYILQIVNPSPQAVDGGGPLVFELPDGAAGAGVLQGSAPNAVAAGRKVTVSGPFAPGNTLVQFAYSVPLGGEQIVLAQKLPAPLARVTVIAQKIGGMQMSSPQLAQRRDMAADGQAYIVGEGGAVKAGETLTLTLHDLPYRATWPRNLALVLAAVVLGAGAWGASRGGSPKVAARRQQIQTKRDKLFADLAALENQRRSGTIDDRAYTVRREQLVTALEDLYAALEREPAA